MSSCLKRRSLDKYLKICLWALMPQNHQSYFKAFSQTGLLEAWIVSKWAIKLELLDWILRIAMGKRKEEMSNRVFGLCSWVVAQGRLWVLLIGVFSFKLKKKDWRLNFTCGRQVWTPCFCAGVCSGRRRARCSSLPLLQTPRAEIAECCLKGLDLKKHRTSDHLLKLYCEERTRCSCCRFRFSFQTDIISSFLHTPQIFAGFVLWSPELQRRV